ncbi:hypothetical protein EST38_g13721, partial [Candolleomyces aberdarensis]
QENLRHFIGEEDQAVADLKDQLKHGERTDIGIFCDDGESEVDPDEIRPDYKTAVIVRVENMRSTDGKIYWSVVLDGEDKPKRVEASLLQGNENFEKFVEEARTSEGQSGGDSQMKDFDVKGFRGHRTGRDGFGYTTKYEGYRKEEFLNSFNVNEGCEDLVTKYWNDFQKSDITVKVTQHNALEVWGKTVGKLDVKRVRALLDEEDLQNELSSIRDIASFVLPARARKKSPTLHSVLESWLDHSSADVIFEAYISIILDDTLPQAVAQFHRVQRCASALASLREDHAKAALAKAVLQWQIGRSLIRVFSWFQKQHSGGGIGELAAKEFRDQGFTKFSKISPYLAKLCSHVMWFLIDVENRYQARKAEQEGRTDTDFDSPSLTPDLGPRPSTPLDSLPGDLYGLRPSGSASDISLQRSVYQEVWARHPWSCQALLSKVVQAILTEELVNPHLIKYDKLLQTTKHLGSPGQAVNRCIVRGAMLLCLVEATQSDAILVSDRMTPLLNSPNFIAGNTCSNTRDAAPKVLNNLDELRGPFVRAAQDLLTPGIRTTLTEMGNVIHTCLVNHFSPSSKNAAKTRHSGRLAVFGPISLDQVMPQDANIAILNLMFRESLQERRGKSWVVESLGRVLRGEHATRSSHSVNNPDHTNPARHFNRLATLLSEYMGDRPLTGPYGLSNLLSWFGTGQGAMTERFQEHLTGHGGFWSESVQDIVAKFNFALQQNDHLATDSVEGLGPVLEGLLKYDDNRAWGQPSNLLSAQPTQRGKNGAKFTLQAKFTPYFEDRVVNNWTSFLGVMAGQDYQKWTGPRKSWKEALEMVHGLRISGIGGLTALQLVNSLALFGVVDMPDQRTLADWIWERPQLGAFRGLEAIGFNIVNTNAARFSFNLVYSHLDQAMSNEDKDLIGFSTIFVEHLLCKVVRWDRRLKQDGSNLTLESLAEDIMKKHGAGIVEPDPFPCPLTLASHLVQQCFSEACTAKMAISFNGKSEAIALGPVADLAVRSLPKLGAVDQLHAYRYLENCISLMLYEGLKGKNVEDFFVHALEGLFDCIHLPPVQSEAEGNLLAGILDSIPHALAREQPAQIEKAKTFVAAIIEDLVQMRFVDQEECRLQWCSPDGRDTRLGQKWIADREIDLVRTLIHVLKDLPNDLPRNIESVVDILVDVITISYTHIELSNDTALGRTRLSHIAGLFFPELQSPSAIVREASQKCISLLVEQSGRPAMELLLPHRDRTLTGIYTKPLRALPFLKQIGMIEAVRFCLKLDPPLADLNDELLRLLHETLALADADDTQLLGPRHLRQSILEVIKLRVACIQLLTAALPLTDFFSRQPQTRQRITGVYFKSLYSPSAEVKDVAHEGLRLVLGHQSRLPKELLQTGLRPILMNLADPKRLSISGLEGLARLLELLTNYFKVEIGHKLLDHFRIVADPQTLQMSPKVPFSENEGIPKLVRLAHIFHLLPPSANIFLESLVNVIVQTETQLHFSTQNPFSEPLAKYLDRYPTEGVDFLFRNLKLPCTVCTFRNILQAKPTPNLQRELASRAQLLGSRLAFGSDTYQLKSALQLVDDLADIDPTFLAQNEYIVEQLVALWNAMAGPHNDVDVAEMTHWHSMIQRVFIQVLQRSPRIDLLFELVSIYSRNLELDTVATTKFLYQHVALSEDLFFRRNVLLRFITWFNDPQYTWQHKCDFIRYVVSPTLLVQASRSLQADRLIDSDFIAQLHRLIWAPLTTKTTDSQGMEDLLRIEFLHLTTILVQHYPDLLEDVKKDIAKYIWFHISNFDDIIVKQMAYLLAAQFFSTFPNPPKFILRAWTGLLQLPQLEGRSPLRHEAMAILASCFPTDTDENGYLLWAKETRRVLQDDGPIQMLPIYHLIVKQPDLFFPVRSLFISHITNSLQKLGLSATSSAESRLLSIEVLTTIFK